MKKLLLYFFSISLITAVSSCSTSNSAYQYDDIYYNPKNDPITKTQNNTTADLNKVENNTNRYLEDNRSSNFAESSSQSPYSEDLPENSEQGNIENVDEYYNEDYAQSLNQINSPMRSINSYDPYQRDRVMYTQDPFFYSPVGYSTMVTAAPFMPSTAYYPGTSIGMGYNNFSGWNATIGYSWGWGSTAMGWGDPFWGNPYYGYVPGCPSYGWSGYNNGNRQGFNDGYYYRGFNNTSNSVKYTNTPRGSSGSRSYTRTNSSNGPNRYGSQNTTIIPNENNTNTLGRSIPKNSTNVVKPNRNNSIERNTTPTRYNPNTKTISRPISPKIETSSPTKTAPQQPSRSNRTINRSRPNYNSNPSYSPSRGGSISRPSSPSRSTSPSRPTSRPSRR